MGAELGRRVTSASVIEMFEKACPFYMSIGMSYTEFWEGDIYLPNFYIEAYKQRAEREQKQMNTAAWLNGVYMKRAYEVVLANMFSKPGTPPQEYYKEPFGNEEHKTQEQKESEQKAEGLRVMVALESFVNFHKNKKKG